nr:immunoglobulin heavy chain junction region [Mus musculus]
CARTEGLRRGFAYW